MSNLESTYTKLCNTWSDIFQHLPTLKRYAEECDHVIEMGVRDVVSTYALLMGTPKKLISIDIIPIGDQKTQELTDMATEIGTDFTFVLGSTTELEIEETDLLFIDTEHNFLQLKTELVMHGNKAKKYLIFHDTVLFGTKDSNQYGNPSLQKIDPDDDKTFGLIPAIEYFLERNPHWVVHEHYPNCNGLTVLKRY